MIAKKWTKISQIGEYARNRGLINLLIGPLVFLIILFTPFELPDLEPEAKRFLAIFLWVAIQWLFTPIPMFMTGLMGVSLAVIFGVAVPREALAPFADPIIFLFLGGFLLARAMEELGFDKKLSVKIITHPIVKGGFKKTFIAVLLVTSFFSMWVSNTATTAMMLPIVLGLLRSLDIKDSYTKSSLLIAMAYAATIGGVATPIGSPPNIIAIGMLSQLADIQVSFLQWMMFGLPICIISLGLLITLVFKKVPDDILNMPIDVEGLKKTTPTQLTFSEKIVITFFSLTVILWFAPSFIDLFSPKDSPLSIWAKASLDPAIVVLLTVTPLFVLPLNSSAKILTSESVKKIDWGSLLLFGSGLSLGGLLFNTGIAGLVGDLLVSTIQADAFYWALVFTIAATVFFTEFTSNTASANILLPIIIAATMSLGIPSLGPALAVAMACNLAFMLPVATPPNAIAYGSGHVEFKYMIRWGIIMNLLGIILLAIVLRILI